MTTATEARQALNPQGGPDWLIAFHEAGMLLYAYEHHSAGASLLRAYAMHRQAWNVWSADPQMQAQEAETLARPAPPGAWIMTNGRQLALQRERILAHMDSIVAHLIVELDRAEPGRSDAQRLADLRRSLKSGMGRAPANAQTQELRWVAAAAVRHELQAGASKAEAYRSAARKLGIAVEFAKRAWVQLREPADAALGARRATTRRKTGGDRKGDFRRARLSGS